MKKKTLKLLLAISLGLMLATITMLLGFANANNAKIWTDQTSYQPGSLVTIYGSGFPVGAEITVTVKNPDLSIYTITPSPIADSQGSFTCTYQLVNDPSAEGTYYVTATGGGLTATTAFTDPTKFTGGEDYSGYDLESGKWEKANLGKAYIEGDWVSYQLGLDDSSPAWGATDLTIYYDFHEANSHAIFIDGFDTSVATGFQYTASAGDLLPDGQQIPPGTGWNPVHIPVPDAGEAQGSGAYITNYMRPFDPQTATYTTDTPTSPAGHNAFTIHNIQWPATGSPNPYVIIFYRAHLALTAIWSKGLEYQLPQSLSGTRFNGWTASHEGASFGSGSSQHFNLAVGAGALTVPIPISSYPIMQISGYKFVNGVPFNGWNITLHANLTLGSGIPPISFNPADVRTGLGTFINGSAWPTGYYEFTGLTAGVFNVTEENRAGYVHTNITATGSNSTAIINIPGGYAIFGLPSGGSEVVNFYNIFGTPNIAITKTPSATKVENGTLVTYTYNVTNIGTIDLTANLTDSILGTIYTNTPIAINQSIITTRTTTLIANTTNVANVTASDSLNRIVNATTSATVRVLHPSLTLTKTPSSTKVETGTNVTYTFNVTNTGDVALTVGISDNVLGVVTSGQSLAVGESKLFFASSVLTANTTNTATATGVDQAGGQASAQASATVRVLHPSLTLTKTPSSTKVLNTTTITYTYNVTNNGDATLFGVNVTDNKLGAVAGPLTLLVGQTQTFTRTTTSNVTVTNTAQAAGVDQLGTNTTATATATVTVIHPSISINKTCAPDNQLAPGNITWTIVVKNTGDIPLSNITIIESRTTISNFSTAGPLAVGGTITIIATEFNLPPGTYYNNATVTAAYQLGTISAWDDATCVIRPVFILKQFTGVTVLPDGRLAGYNATLVNGTQVNINGTKSGPYIYFNITYYFENSLNFLGDSFDGQAHNFTLWDKWGGNLLALGSPPISFNPTKNGPNANRLTLADTSTFRIDPSLTGPDSYRGYIGNGLDISNLASQGQAFITMHLGDQQNATNPGKGKGTGNDGSSYDTDTVWYIGQLGVNQSATLTLFIAPGKNPGGQLEFTSLGCTTINTGPRVRAYGDTYNNDDFLFAVDRTNTLDVCVFPK